MRCITAHNVNRALAEGLEHLLHFHIEMPSRNGPVWVAPTPVITTYKNPHMKVLFSPLRNANPFFHVMEALWMLAGRNDLTWPLKFNKGFKNYSDDGHTLHGAYGYRWRKHFKMDQIPLIVEELHRNPESRRAVLAMWDAPAEWAAMAFGDARDIPCNNLAYFDLIGGRLNMTVCCRSNDILWGAYGANAVHFSFLLEYMAARLRAPIGEYRQFSNNFHLYPENLPAPVEKLIEDVRNHDRYIAKRNLPSGHVLYDNERTSITAPESVLMVDGEPAVFDVTLESWFDEPHNLTGFPFLDFVAFPMFKAWDAYKTKDYYLAEEWAGKIVAKDWRMACVEWLERKHARRNAKAIG